MFQYLIDLIYLLLGYEKELPATQCRQSQLLVAPKQLTFNAYIFGFFTPTV